MLVTMATNTIRGMATTAMITIEDFKITIKGDLEIFLSITKDMLSIVSMVTKVMVIWRAKVMEGLISRWVVTHIWKTMVQIIRKLDLLIRVP